MLAEIPVPVTRQVLQRGQRAVRHLLRALPRPPRRRSGHDRAARLQAADVVPRPAAAQASPAGYFFDVITNGFAVMPSYAAQITARRSLGDRRLHPRAAALAERAACRAARRRPASGRRGCQRARGLARATAGDGRTLSGIVPRTPPRAERGAASAGGGLRAAGRDCRAAQPLVDRRRYGGGPLRHRGAHQPGSSSTAPTWSVTCCGRAWRWAPARCSCSTTCRAAPGG